MAIKYKWLAEKLRTLIKKLHDSGIDKLPTEAELGSRYRVSRQTVRQALTILEEEGVIEKRRGSGSYITGRNLSLSTNIVAILLTTDSDYIYPSLLQDIQSTLLQSSYASEIFVTENRTDKEREYLESLLSKKNRPLGLIVEGVRSAFPNPNLDLYRRLMQDGVPVLFIHNQYKELHGSIYVQSNDYQGATELVKHLHNKGHRYIAAVFPADDLQGHERYKGFVETMRSYNLPINDDYIGWLHRSDLIDIEKNRDTIFLRKLVSQVQYILENRIPCSAIVCFNDEIAYFLIREIKKLGASIPEDFAVVSFDNSYLASSSIPGITSMGHEPHLVGKTAATSMIELIRGKSVASVKLEWTLHKRASS